MPEQNIPISSRNSRKYILPLAILLIVVLAGFGYWSLLPGSCTKGQNDE